MRRAQNLKTVVTTIFATFCFLGLIIFLIMGGIYFGQQYPKVLNYVNSTCQVDTINYQQYSCRTRYYSYTCYGPIWKVHHDPNRTIYAKIEIEQRYRSYLNALNKANEYQIGMSYSCWYDTRNPSVAQWDKPNAALGIILLSLGGLSTLFFIIFFFLTYRFVQQAKRQNKQDILH